MEAKILSGVLSTDTHARLQAGDQLLGYLRDDKNDLVEFEDLDRLIGGLASWMGSSNFKISLSAMDILIMMIIELKDKFKPFLSTIVPVIREKLGDAKEQVREKSQMLLQQIMQDTVNSPQKFLEHLLEGVLSHKNWRVKEQGLLYISRTLSFFGSGHISVSKFVGTICDMLGDANAQVRSGALDCLVEIYQHVGVKVRIDLSKRGLPASKLQIVLKKFDEVDKLGGVNGLIGDDDESVSSCSSSTSLSSAKTQGSTQTSQPTSSLATKRKTNGLSSGGGSGALAEEDFLKAFSDIPQMNIFTQHDVEVAISSIHQTLNNKKTEWEARIESLKELKAIVQCEVIDQQTFIPLLRTLEIPFSESIKDLRSQVVREACITLSCLSFHLRVEMAQFAEAMLPNLIALLPNSAKIMASSAAVCMQILIRNCPSYRLVGPITQCIQTSKSPATRKYCAEFLDMITHIWDTNVLDRAGSAIEEVIVKGLKDADPTARKFMRRAFWGYHSHYPTAADKLFDSFDSNVQKHLNDEKNGSSSSGQIQLSQVKSKLKKSNLAFELDSLPPRPPSSSAILPSIKVRIPTMKVAVDKTRRTAEPGLSMYKKLSKSSENLLSDSSSLGAPIRISTKPISRKQSDGIVQRPVTPSKRVNYSTSDHHDSKSVSLSRKMVTGLSQDALRYFGGGGDDDDETGSVTSERSSFSISSEVSISPYAAKYPNPVTDLDELIKLCVSKSWSDRRDGIIQIHLMFESDVHLSHTDTLKIKDVFKRLFAEPHAKVYGLFLETLIRFIEEHHAYLDDWLFLLLLRLLHKQGTDMTKSIQFKLQLVLETVRRAFLYDQQFNVLCRIVNDQSQPMNNRVKQAWLEYIHELIPSMNSEDFKDTPDTRQTFSKLLSLTIEPKSVEIRKASQRVVNDLFNLNAAAFSLMLRGVPRNLQDNADRIIKGFMQDTSSSGEEFESPLPSPKRINATPTNKTNTSRTPKQLDLVPETLSTFRHISSSPDMFSLGYDGVSTPKSNRTPHSRLPVSSGKISSSGGHNTPSRIPRPSSRQGGGYPPRAQSVDPERMMYTHTQVTPVSRDRYRRPVSSQSENVTTLSLPPGYANGIRNSMDVRPPSSQGFMLDHFISHLPVLDFGVPDPDGEAQDQVGLLLKQLKNATSPKLRGTALQSLYTLARSYDNRSWSDHISETFTVLIDCVKDDEALVRTMTLRVMRELLKARPPGVTRFTDGLVTVVLDLFKDGDCNVSQASEDLFTPLSGSLPPQRLLNILEPVISNGADTSNLGALKLLSKLVSHTDRSQMEARLNTLVPGIVQGYCHEESNVRKASVFCLVEIHGIVGELLRPHLGALSSSQTKLLDLYIKRHHATTNTKKIHPTTSEQ